MGRLCQNTKAVLKICWKFRISVSELSASEPCFHGQKPEISVPVPGNTYIWQRLPARRGREGGTFLTHTATIWTEQSHARYINLTLNTIWPTQTRRQWAVIVLRYHFNVGHCAVFQWVFETSCVTPNLLFIHFVVSAGIQTMFCGNTVGKSQTSFLEHWIYQTENISLSVCLIENTTLLHYKGQYFNNV